MTTGITAHARNIRQSARKVRLVVDLIRGLSAHAALVQLAVTGKAARVPVERVLRSAIANAEHNFQKNSDDLFIKEIQVNQGAPLKRWRPRAFGRAAPLKKHSCHISIVLAEIQGVSRSSRRPKASDAPVVETFGTIGAPLSSIRDVTIEKAGTTDEHMHASRSAPFDKTRAGRHETAQKIRKEKKISMLKKIIQRKTGSS
jgi:large subunit ribosomal protein L22